MGVGGARVRFAAAGVLMLAGLPGCGSATAPGGATAGTAPAGCTGTVRVAVDPLASADVTDGATSQLGARLAVDQANADRLLGDCYIAFGPAEAASPSPTTDPSAAPTALGTLARDPDVVGVVGPFRSPAAPAELPVANRAGLTMISPSDTDPGLTIEGSNPDVDTRALRPAGIQTFFRVCATDLGEGRALARVATDGPSARRFLVVDDESSYGKRLADQFQRYLGLSRGSDVHRLSDSPTKRDFHDDLVKARQQGVDIVFYGGSSASMAGALRRSMVSVLPRAQFLGVDAIVTPAFLTAAGGGADGALATLVAADPNQLDRARRFLNDYQVNFNANPGPYSIAAYDAMNILLQAIKRSIADSGGTLPSDRRTLRELVRGRVATMSYDGILGRTTFNDRGDTSNVLVTLERAGGGRWAYDRTVQFRI